MMLECSGCFSEIFNSTVFWVFDIESMILLVFGGCSLWWCSVCCGGAEERSGPPGGLPVAHITPSLWARGSARPEETDTCAAGTDTPTDRRDTAPLLTLDQESHHRAVLPAGHIHSVWD